MVARLQNRVTGFIYFMNFELGTFVSGFQRLQMIINKASRLDFIKC